MIAEFIARNTTPLCFLPDGRLICYSYGKIVMLPKNKGERAIKLPLITKERLLGWNRLVTRLLRLGVRTAIADDECITLSIGNQLCEINTKTNSLSKGYFFDKGIRPLALTSVSDINGFERGVYFGGYVRNFEKKPVNIYKRVATDSWKVIYTFPERTINHVHNVIPDPYRQCLWVFTGDFGESAAIWKVTDGFKKVERFVSGNQKWRGCVAFAIPEGILYATDAPFAQNHIYLMKEDGTTSVIADLPGSCIYGCQWKDRYVFSTAVEADGRNETPLRLLFGWKRGAGIKDNYAHIFCGNIKDGFYEIYKEKKDRRPFILQFGAIKFPSGLNPTDTLYFQPIATCKNDLSLMSLSVSSCGYTRII